MADISDSLTGVRGIAVTGIVAKKALDVMGGKQHRGKKKKFKKYRI